MLFGPSGARGFKWVRKNIGTYTDTIKDAVLFNLPVCADDNSLPPYTIMRRLPMDICAFFCVDVKNCQFYFVFFFKFEVFHKRKKCRVAFRKKINCNFFFVFLLNHVFCA